MAPEISFYLPKKTPTKCTTCRGPGTEFFPLILCPGCSTTAHCSKKCREKDPGHNSNSCVSRVHLELGRLYPFIAWAAELTRLQHLGNNPALWHEVTDIPARDRVGNSRARGGPSTCVIRYGRPMKEVPPLPPRDPNSPDSLVRRPESPPFYPPPLLRWFSSCLKLTQRAYLRRRISRDGHLLPVVLGMGIAVLLELFSMTKEDPTSACLHFLGKPIHDFGICRGTVHVEPYRVMSYIKEGSDEPPKQLQSPEEHFWLYFTTENEEERLYLDVGLFVYGYRYHVVNGDIYLPPRDHKEACEILQRLLEVPSSTLEYLDPYAAVHFSDNKLRREMEHQDFRLHHVTERFTILRNCHLTDALASGVHRTRNDPAGRFPWKFKKSAVDTLCQYMEEADLYAKTLGNMEIEMMFLMDTINNGGRILRHVLDEEKWKNMPYPRVENCKWELGLNPKEPDP